MKLIRKHNNSNNYNKLDINNNDDKESTLKNR